MKYIENSDQLFFIIQYITCNIHFMEFSGNLHSQEVAGGTSGPSSVRCFRFKNRFLWIGFRTGTSLLLQETKWYRTKMFC
jgi:hypothetical protein